MPLGVCLFGKAPCWEDPVCGFKPLTVVVQITKIMCMRVFLGALASTFSQSLSLENGRDHIVAVSAKFVYALINLHRKVIIVAQSQVQKEKKERELPASHDCMLVAILYIAQEAW